MATSIALIQLVSCQHGQTETVHGLFGNSVTLVCDSTNNVDNTYFLTWYHKDRELYISYDSNLYTNVPDSIKDRFSVACTRNYNTDRCSLKINSLLLADEGTYECSHIDGGYNLVYSADLQVGYGQLPSVNSPVCELFKVSNDGSYIPTDVHQILFTIGDEILLRCDVYGSTLDPSLSWARRQDDGINTLTPYVKGVLFHHKFALPKMILG